MPPFNLQFGKLNCPELVVVELHPEIPTRKCRTFLLVHRISHHTVYRTYIHSVASCMSVYIFRHCPVYYCVQYYTIPYTLALASTSIIHDACIYSLQTCMYIIYYIIIILCMMYVCQCSCTQYLSSFQFYVGRSQARSSRDLGNL